MTNNLIDRIGDWNPQLLREIKGRLKVRNVLIAVAISLLGQLLLFTFFSGKLPAEKTYYVEKIFNRYCTVPDSYGVEKLCLRDAAGNFIINWQLWWLDQFIWLSVISIFALVVVGTYMLISDFANEERRGTLNFIRLSPQSTQSILVGKLLGVPILLYLAALLTAPLHLWSGLSAQITLNGILSFWVVLAVSCLFFYSAALLFGLVTSSLGGFQPWLASGFLLIFLYIASFNPIQHNPANWLNLFSPSLLLSYLVSGTGIKYGNPFSYVKIDSLEFFYIQIGASVVSAVALAVANYGLWTYGIWQALMRRFPNPSKTMLSKRQSYLLAAGFEVVMLGFALQTPEKSRYYSGQLSTNLGWVLFFNLLLFLFLIAALSPQRQALYDWARYRWEKVGNRQRFWSRSLIRDLIWGEKSPAMGAIALNLVITSLPVMTWILFWPEEADKMEAFCKVLLAIDAILILASLAQLMLFLKTQQQTLWAIGTVSAAISLPPLIIWVLNVGYGKAPSELWLFSAFPWGAVLGDTATTTVFLAMLGQLSVLFLLNLQLTRRLRIAGASATKALMDRPRLTSVDR